MLSDVVSGRSIQAGARPLLIVAVARRNHHGFGRDPGGAVGACSCNRPWSGREKYLFSLFIFTPCDIFGGAILTQNRLKNLFFLILFFDTLVKNYSQNPLERSGRWRSPMDFRRCEKHAAERTLTGREASMSRIMAQSHS